MMYDDADALRGAQPWLTPRGTTEVERRHRKPQAHRLWLDGARVPRLIEPFVKNYSGRRRCY